MLNCLTALSLKRWPILWVTLLISLSFKAEALGKTAPQDPDQQNSESENQDANRTEIVPLPALGGNSDMGFLFGAVLSIAHFDPKYTPYHWKSLAIAVLSVKNGPGGAEVPTYNFIGSFDFPGLAGGQLRLKPMIGFSRALNNGYYGLGNQSQPFVTTDEIKRPNEYIGNNLTVRLGAEWLMTDRIKLLLNGGFLYALPRIYAGSQLEADSQVPAELIYGTSDHGLFQLEVGAVYDSRDHEVVPSKGMYHKLTARSSPIWYWCGNVHSSAGISADVRFFAPLWGSNLVGAFRLLGDLIFGNAPFYELDGFGLFSPGFTGSSGVRGLPQGRYHGQVKIMANVELRAMIVDFMLGETKFAVGLAGFLDTGRVWAELKKNKTLDGTGLGLKFGTGGGPRVKWGEAVCLRFDVAYSPDATDAPSGLPVGLYMEMAQAF